MRKPIVVTGRVLSVNETVRRLNPEVFGVAGLQNPERQRDQRSESQDPELVKSTTGVAFSITIISLRRRLVDGHDNLRTGAKPLVDAVTASLGFASDDNPRLNWEYGQMLSQNEGTIVKIERL